MHTPAHGRAGGKVILLGEHAVVYGRPALASGIPLAVDATVDAGDGPRLLSEVPAGERVCKALSGRQNHCESAMVTCDFEIGRAREHEKRTRPSPEAQPVR